MKTTEKIVLTLLEQRIIQDLRINPNEALEGEERRKANLLVGAADWALSRDRITVTVLPTMGQVVNNLFSQSASSLTTAS
jgi:hypothetical protein